MPIMTQMIGDLEVAGTDVRATLICDPETLEDFGGPVIEIHNYLRGIIVPVAAAGDLALALLALAASS